MFHIQESTADTYVPQPRAALRLVEAPPESASLYGRAGKRWLDLVLGTFLLVVTLPLLLAGAIAVRVSLGRGVLFRQSRVGLHGEDFEMIKFRTMRHSRRTEQREFDGPDRRQTHKTVDDPRHTVVGAVLRKTSLDELPQLVHVVSGRMSLVGPRPELSTVCDKYGLRAHRRHSVRPGLTGAWQVTHRSNGTHLHECFDDDLDYVDQLSLRGDLSIMRRTIAVVLSAKGM